MSLPRSLYGRLALALAVLFTVVALGMVAVAHHFSGLYQQEATQRLHADLAGHIVAEKLLMRNGRVDARALDEIFHMLMVINPAIELYLLDPSGRMLAYSAPPGKVKRASIDLAPVRDFLARRSDFPILGDDPHDLEGRKIFSVAPISQGKQLQGYLYVILASEVASSVAQGLRASYARQEGAWTIALGLLAAFVAGLAAMFGLTRRLRRLTLDIARFKQGELAETDAVQVTAGDEIAQLQGCFRQMAVRIESQMRQLKERDEQRRERVAKLSHDLRTSLTVMHGYLETLHLKADRLSGEESRKFLHTAVKHSGLLADMVSDFFELAKLEYREVAPQRERFSIGELAQDVVQKFQPTVSMRGVHLSCEAGPGLHWVEADIGMMDRALTNLVANAVKFTPAGGAVSVRLACDGKQVRVAVEDTGCGIDSEYLLHLREGSASALPPGRSRPDSSGFGLAIVTHILLLHGSSLSIRSVYGQGSCFSFLLTLDASEPLRMPVIEM